MKALVIGAHGQDGRLLMRGLQDRGHEALGLCRRASTAANVVQTDIRNAEALDALLRSWTPETIFHVAAVHGHAGTRYEDVWREMLEVNVASVHVVLEYLRRQGSCVQFVYASSGKMFGSPLPDHIDSRTPYRPNCLYGLTKQAAVGAIRYYRETHGVTASALHLFHHKSPLRAPAFFFPRLVGILAGAIGDQNYRKSLDTLNFYCDWGSAAEYMDIAIALSEARLLQRDYLVARGECLLARDLAARMFARFGLDYRDHITEERPDGPLLQPHYQVRCDQLDKHLNRLPRVTAESLGLQMLITTHNIHASQTP